jgi:hypothetical protein
MLLCKIAFIMHGHYHGHCVHEGVHVNNSVYKGHNVLLNVLLDPQVGFQPTFSAAITVPCLEDRSGYGGMVNYYRPITT